MSLDMSSQYRMSAMFHLPYKLLVGHYCVLRASLYAHLEIDCLNFWIHFPLDILAQGRSDNGT
jgi:hypothetical protein